MSMNSPTTESVMAVWKMRMSCTVVSAGAPASIMMREASFMAAVPARMATEVP